MILIIKDQFRLCKDGNWREFANFGTYESCVNVYKSIGHAFRRAKRIGGQVVRIPVGYEVDAVGKVISRTPTKSGYEKVNHHSLSEFVVEKI